MKDQNVYPSMPYSPLCNHCWLGIPHSSGAHLDSVKESRTTGTELHRIAVNRGYLPATGR